MLLPMKPIEEQPQNLDSSNSSGVSHNWEGGGGVTFGVHVVPIWVPAI